jgi:ATP-dependent DNA helicase HFM1/MER3
LHIIAQATEFKDLRLKPNERASYRDLNKSPFIKSPIKENIMTYAHKVSLLIQVQLGGVDLPMNKEFGGIRRQFLSEKTICFDRVQGLVRCVVECKAYECDAVATCNALELARSISAEFWENSTLQLRQIPNIGPAAVRKLIQANIKTIEQIVKIDAAAIERILSRNPPFGMKILEFTASFPRLTLRAHIMRKILKEGSPVKVQVKAQLGFSNAKVPYWNRRMPCMTFVASISNGTLAHIWRGPIKKLEKGFDVTFTGELWGVEDTVICQLACEELVGTVQTVVIEPDIPACAFPPPKPVSAAEVLGPVEIGTQPVRSGDPENGVEVTIGDVKDGLCENIGSDYGGDSVFDDFVDINTFDENIEIEHGDEERETSVSEPVQMKNGKWQCNHKCRDGQLTKNGQPCKHRCCREGLDKPRKVQRKKAAVENDLKEPRIASSDIKKPKAVQKPSKKALGPKLKLAEHEIYFDEVEELDLADEQLVVEEADIFSHRESTGLREVKKASSMRLPRIAPVFDNASGSQPDVSIWHKQYQGPGSDEDFPSPSALVGAEETDDDGLLEELELPVESWYEQADPVRSPKATRQKHGSSEDMVPGFDDISKTRISSSIKRLASPLPNEPHSKRHCAAEQVEKAVEAKAARPEWVNDIDPDLVAFFEGWAEFV